MDGMDERDGLYEEDEMEEMGMDEVVPRPIPIPGIGLVCAHGCCDPWSNLFIIDPEEACPPESFEVYHDGRIVGYSSPLLPEDQGRDLVGSELRVPLPLQQWLLALAQRLERDLMMEQTEERAVQVKVKGDPLEENYTRFFRRITGTETPTDY